MNKVFSETKRGQVLNYLRSCGQKGCTNIELSKIAIRYGGYLGALYDEGYNIHKEHLGDGVFRYTLVNEPPPNFKKRDKAIDKLVNAVESRGYIVAEEIVALLETEGLCVRYKAKA